MRILKSLMEKGKNYKVPECCWCGTTPVIRKKKTGSSFQYKVGCSGCKEYTQLFPSEEEAVEAWTTDEVQVNVKGPALNLM